MPYRDAFLRLTRIFWLACTAAALGTVVWFFYWTIDSSYGFGDRGDSDYHQLLTRGFRQGHLHLDLSPPAELLALEDPYDPRQNAPFRLPDASYFRGHYYVYFGPAPAATLMLPYLLLTGRTFTTGAAVFVFCTAGFLAASGVWLAIRRRYFPQSAPCVAPLGVLAFGLGVHFLALARRPMWWELPIAAGIAFSMFALVAVYVALHGRRPALAVAVAGLFLGLAVASRPTCLFGAPLLLAPVWLATRQLNARREVWRLALAAVAPLGACLIALLAYNYARFGNAFEFGQSYQLSGTYESKWQHFSGRYIVHNFAVYFFQPLTWSGEFPFAAARAIPVVIPGYFGTEQVGGAGVTFPFMWLALAVPLAWRGRPENETRHLRAMIWAMAGYFVPVTALMLSYFSTTARYQADFLPMLGVLSLCGWLGIERWAQSKRPAGTGKPARISPALATFRGWVVRSARVLLGRARLPGGVTDESRARSAQHSGNQLYHFDSRKQQRTHWPFLVTSLTFGAAIVTALTGVLLSFDYHGRSLSRENSRLWTKLERRSETALARTAFRLGLLDGPRVLKVRFVPRPTGTVETFWRATDPQAEEGIVIEYIGEREIHFGYARSNQAVLWGRPLTWQPNHTHTVELQVPSLYGRSNGAWRHATTFRERSCVAVWFSGGRALGAVVAPSAADTIGGGKPGSDFSGMITSTRSRLFRDDEARAEMRVVGGGPNGDVSGGVLRLQLVLPDEIAPAGEPLFATGTQYGSDIVFVRPAGDGRVKFGFEHYGSPQSESAPLRVDPGVPLSVEIALPSCAVGSFSGAATGEVTVRVDGAEVIRTRSACVPFAAGTEMIGRNLLGTTCGPRFRGWLLEARWEE